MVCAYNHHFKFLGITYYYWYYLLWCDHSNQTFTWYYSIFSVCQMELENEATVQSNVHLKVVQQYKEMIVKDESF